MSDRLYRLLRDPDTVNIDHDPDVRCPCVANHTPQPVSYDVHHVLPLSWGGHRNPDNEVVVCPTVHRVVHYGLTALRSGRDVDWRRITPYARDLIAQGWARYLEVRP